jgi:hypothetical protein
MAKAFGNVAPPPQEPAPVVVIQPLGTASKLAGMRGFEPELSEAAANVSGAKRRKRKAIQERLTLEIPAEVMDQLVDLSKARPRKPLRAVVLSLFAKAGIVVDEAEIGDKRGVK